MASYLDSLFSLAGRRAVVTGGSSGIGSGVAEALGRAGADIVVVARSADRLRATVDSLTQLGVTASYVACDLGERGAIEHLVEQVGESGQADILVNCAGVNIRPPMAELSASDWDVTMAVNIAAPYLLGQGFGPQMAQRGWGRIINVGSQQSISAFGRSGAYGVSKAAVAGLSRSQAEAWSADGVTCNTIVPGFVVTPMTQQTIAEPGREQALAGRTMVGRNGIPADFAGAAVFLASDAAGYITGTTLFVDGGFSVH